MRDDLTIFSNRFLQVEALLCDHRVPSLAFRINEQPAFLIDSNKLAQAGFTPGPWISELKRRFFTGQLAEGPLAVLLEDGSEKQVANVAELCQRIGQHQQPAAIGYISDIGFTEHNRQQLAQLFSNVELLICETTFLAADEVKARNSFHLCTSDINQLLTQLRPRWFMPMHLSKTYSRRCAEIYRELQPPPGTTLLQLPKHTTPAPRLLHDFSWQSHIE
jgi:ribonuclease Z